MASCGAGESNQHVRVCRVAFAAIDRFEVGVLFLSRFEVGVLFLNPFSKPPFSKPSALSVGGSGDGYSIITWLWPITRINLFDFTSFYHLLQGLID